MGEGRGEGERVRGRDAGGIEIFRGEVRKGVGSREKVKKIEEGGEKKNRNGWDGGMERGTVERDEAREMKRGRDGRERGEMGGRG